MFIERLRPIDLGEPIYARKTIGCAPKGAAESQSGLPIYKHFTATRFLRQAATDCHLRLLCAELLEHIGGVRISGIHLQRFLVVFNCQFSVAAFHVCFAKTVIDVPRCRESLSVQLQNR